MDWFLWMMWEWIVLRPTFKCMKTAEEWERVKRHDCPPDFSFSFTNLRRARYLELKMYELDEIAHQGKMIRSVFHIEDGDRMERRLVQLEDGRVFLCCIRYKAEERGTGVFKTDCFMGYVSRYEVVELTGAYMPPQVEWVTDSHAQFRKEELEAIAA